MKAQFVYENLDFERGRDVKTSLDIGLLPTIWQDMINNEHKGDYYAWRGPNKYVVKPFKKDYPDENYTRKKGHLWINDIRALSFLSFKPKGQTLEDIKKSMERIRLISHTDNIEEIKSYIEEGIIKNHEYLKPQLERRGKFEILKILKNEKDVDKTKNIRGVSKYIYREPIYDRNGVPQEPLFLVKFNRNTGNNKEIIPLSLIKSLYREFPV